MTPLAFVSVGFGNAIAVWRIVAVMIPDSAAARRRLKQAKDHDRFQDLTFGRAIKCLLLLDDGTVVGCGITHKTIVARLARTEDDTDEMEED